MASDARPVDPRLCQSVLLQSVHSRCRAQSRSAISWKCGDIEAKLLERHPPDHFDFPSLAVCEATKGQGHRLEERKPDDAGGIQKAHGGWPFWKNLHLLAR